MRRAILWNAQGFPALQPLFEKIVASGLQPGCDKFSCISCTMNDALQHQLLPVDRAQPGGAGVYTKN
jgi:hypothetical protein